MREINNLYDCNGMSRMVQLYMYWLLWVCITCNWISIQPDCLFRDIENLDEYSPYLRTQKVLGAQSYGFSHLEPSSENDHGRS